jgi:hypothetical protein
MTHYGTWASYNGDVRIWLAIGLLAIAGGVVLAGIRLPLPVRFTRPGLAGQVVMIAAWAASIAALLVSATIYIKQSANVVDVSTLPAPHGDPITPVTLTAAVVVFGIIIARRSPRFRTRLVAAIIGAMAGATIFEMPFDLIIMPRSHPHVDPAFYRLLLFGCLFAIEISTLLFLRLSPMARVTRATFFCFALMLGVFAIWALAGFSYPSAPLPTALNMISKVLAFVTALTLFLPQPASPPPALDSAVSAEIADAPQLTGQR